MQNFSVQLSSFEGPLDLMLHLIKEKKLDLFDLKMDVLIDQYIAFLNQVENKLEIASEYLYELAALIEYKSKKSLPVEPKVLEVEDYEEDQRDALVRRLIEYQQFKEISQDLNDRYQNRLKQFEKPIESTRFNGGEDRMMQFEGAEPSDLVKAMQRILQRFRYANPQQVRITKTEFSIEDRINQLHVMIHTLKEPFYFDDMIQDADELGLLIVSFLAILELARRQELSFEIKADHVEFRRGEAYGLNT